VGVLIHPSTPTDRLERLGGVPLERIVTSPAPGTATEADVEIYCQSADRLCELVDGVLVEKAMGFWESSLGLWLGHALLEYLDVHPLGIVAGAGGALRLAPGLIRTPELSFLSWDRLPGRRPPTDPIPALAPDLAVEILRNGNTAAETERKVRDYFSAGTRLMWIINPRSRSAEVYTSLNHHHSIDESGALEGNVVLPGFSLPLGPWLDTIHLRAPE
jgi:Uma2 family endonuclease